MRKPTPMDHKIENVWIGTSGLVLPVVKRDFPENFKSSSRLRYYSSFFNSIEINSSFYKIHRASTYQRWSREVMNDFRFTIKLWKEISHRKQLAYSYRDLQQFITSLAIEQERKGCLLIQFPASIQAERLDQVSKLISELDSLLPGDHWIFCLEFRHESWYHNSIISDLESFGAVLVYQDIAKSRTPLHLGHSSVIYLRFHGPEPGYRGSYTPDTLTHYAEMISDWATRGKQVYVYFNNTLGDALGNATYLKGEIERAT